MVPRVAAAASRGSRPGGLLRLLLLWAAWTSVAPQALETLLSMPCPNLCSGHGWCDMGDGRCRCYEGFYGADCSFRYCPLGPAWADEPVAIVATDVAHNKVECSRRGLCDVDAGSCICDAGFEGSACERKSCNCNGNGRCVSMEYLATQMDPGAGETYVYEANWDAEMLFGCVCDAGYEGYDCSLRSCPLGDDPLTRGQVTEVQRLTCVADGGSAVVAFGSKNRAWTTALASSASAATVAAALTRLRTVTRVEGGSPTGVKVTLSAGRTAWCNDDGLTVTTVEFVADFGSPPLLRVDASALTLSTAGVNASVAVVRSRVGTKESEECSNRGLCDKVTGTCECSLLSSCPEDCWATSNGYGLAGSRGDCGLALVPIDDCPGEVPCSGFGHCDAATFRCECQDGYTGADCSLMTCPQGPAWFSAPAADDVAHTSATLTECSNAGLCNREYGECECDADFEGAACELLRCPGDPVCSGHGQCLSMYLLAQASTKNGVRQAWTYGATPNDPEHWDWDTVRGCKCNLGWTLHDCSGRVCPFGDDPLSTTTTAGATQNNEVQLLNCDLDPDTADSVTFTFREEVTRSLDPLTMTLADLEAALEELETIEDVRLRLDVVANNNGTELACTDAGRDIHVHFLRPTGDVPLLVVSDVFTFSISEDTKGTKEYEECSNRGLCDRATGVCDCFPGYGSSDGQGGRGPWADCGMVLPVVDALQDRALQN